MWIELICEIGEICGYSWSFPHRCFRFIAHHMSTDRTTELTRLLDAFHAGETNAVDQLSNAVHEQLRAMARRHLK